MCCSLKLHPDWMYVFKGRGIAMSTLFLLSMVGSICVHAMYDEINHGPLPNAPPPPQRKNTGFRVGTDGITDKIRIYHDVDNTTIDSITDKGAFNRSVSEIREYYRKWHRPETLMEKMMIWMCYFTFFFYNTTLTFSQIMIAVFLKTRGRDLYQLTNFFTTGVNWLFLLVTIFTVKESVSSVIAFSLEVIITVYAMILQHNIIPLFIFEEDIQLEVRRYLSRNEEIPLEVFNYLRDRGFLRSRANSVDFEGREANFGSLLDLGDLQDLERENGTLDELSELTASTSGSLEDIESHM